MKKMLCNNHWLMYLIIMTLFGCSKKRELFLQIDFYPSFFYHTTIKLNITNEESTLKYSAFDNTKKNVFFDSTKLDFREVKQVVSAINELKVLLMNNDTSSKVLDGITIKTFIIQDGVTNTFFCLSPNSKTNPRFINFIKTILELVSRQFKNEAKYNEELLEHFST